MTHKEYTYRNTTFACYRGYITQAIVNNLIPLLFIVFHTNYEISYAKLGQLVFINFATQLLTDIWATKYADRFGYRKCIVFAHAFCGIGLLSLGILPFIMSSTYLGLVISVMLYAIGGGLLEVLVSPIIEALPNENKEASMSLLHSFYCWGQMAVVFLSTLIIAVIGRVYWFLLPLLWSLFPLYNLFQFLKVPILPLVHEGNGMSFRELFTTPVLYLGMLLMLGAGASELTMSQWSSIFAERGLQVSKLVGDLLGPGLFALFMGIGRTIYGHFGDRLPLKPFLFGSSLLCIVTYVVTVFSPIPVLSLIACSLTGLSVSLMWPGTFSLSSSKFPRGGTLLFGILAICGDLGCSIGPWLTGKLSDAAQSNDTFFLNNLFGNIGSEQLGLRIGILSGVIFPILIVVSLIVFKSNSKK